MHTPFLCVWKLNREMRRAGRLKVWIGRRGVKEEGLKGIVRG